MNRILKFNSNLNKKREIKIISLLVLIFMIILILSAFSEILSNNLNLDNPLISKELKLEMKDSYRTYFLISTITLIPVLILRFLKQNLIALILGIVMIGIYYLI